MKGRPYSKIKAVCRVCGQMVQLTDTGRLQNHPDPSQFQENGVKPLCRGSGEDATMFPQVRWAHGDVVYDLPPEKKVKKIARASVMCAVCHADVPVVNGRVKTHPPYHMRDANASGANLDASGACLGSGEVVKGLGGDEDKMETKTKAKAYKDLKVTCRVCGEKIQLTDIGSLTNHTDKSLSRRGLYYVCQGSGEDATLYPEVRLARGDNVQLETVPAPVPIYQRVQYMLNVPKVMREAGANLLIQARDSFDQFTPQGVAKAKIIRQSDPEDLGEKWVDEKYLTNYLVALYTAERYFTDESRSPETAYGTLMLANALFLNKLLSIILSALDGAKLSHIYMNAQRDYVLHRDASKDETLPTTPTPDEGDDDD